MYHSTMASDVTIKSGEYYVIEILDVRVIAPNRHSIRKWCYDNCMEPWGFSSTFRTYGRSKITGNYDGVSYISYFAFKSKMDATALALSYNNEISVEYVSWRTGTKFTIVTQTKREES